MWMAVRTPILMMQVLPSWRRNAEGSFCYRLPHAARTFRMPFGFCGRRDFQFWLFIKRICSWHVFGVTYRQRIIRISNSSFFTSSFQVNPYLIMRFVMTLNKYAQKSIQKNTSISCYFCVHVVEISYQDSDFEGWLKNTGVLILEKRLHGK